MKIGVEFSIDVTKIDKARLVKHDNGRTYLSMTSFIDVDNKDKYNNNGMVVHSQTKEEKANKTRTPILGNAKVFWSEGGTVQKDSTVQKPSFDDMDSDIPF